MIDGHDGFAAISVLTTIGAMALTDISMLITSRVMLSLLVGTIVFGLFNLGVFGRRKVFLGDSGSTAIGFLLGWLLIVNSQTPQPKLPPEMVVWCVSLPLLDMARVIYRRLRIQKNVISGDSSHIHHFLHKLGFSRFESIAIFSLLNALLVAIGYTVCSTAPELSSIAFIVVFVTYCFCFSFIEGHTRFKNN